LYCSIYYTLLLIYYAQ